MKKTVQSKMEHPESNNLDRPCKWGRPEFEAVDGIGEQELWTLGGLIVAIGTINNEEQRVIGSGVMIAPGLCLTATHVIEETKKNKNTLLYSFPCENNLRIWWANDFSAQEKISLEILPFQTPIPKFSDVGILSYSPFSKFSDNEDYVFAPLEVSAPKLNERLWAVGYREVENDGVPTVSFFVTSGLVTEQYLDGRGSQINGPCIEVAMEALGGMSGGPVFNAGGRIVGVISSSLEGHSDNKGPTYVSLIWTSLLSTVYSPWPQNIWSENVAGIQTKANDSSARIRGSAYIDDEGSYKVKFPKQSEDSMMSVLKSAGIEPPNIDYDFNDFTYDNIETFLEEEGINFLSTINSETFARAIHGKDHAETIKLFKCVDAQTTDGLEDLFIESTLLLEDGNIGIDATFNIRSVFLKLRMSIQDYKFNEGIINSAKNLHYDESDDDYVYYNHFTRPYFRVNLTYNTQLERCQDLRFQLVTMVKKNTKRPK